MALESIQAGAWSLVPALLAISLAWYTRDALIGLFVGVSSTGVIYGALRPGRVGVPKDLTAIGLVPTLVLGFVVPEGFRIIPY